MDKEEKSHSCGKKVIAWLIGVFVVLGVIPALLVIGTVPERQVKDIAGMEENMAVMSVVSKLSNSLFTKDNKVAAESTVELTPAEVNALLSTVIRAYQLKHSGSSDAVLFGELKDGKVYLYAGQPFLGKLSVNGRVAVVPEVAGKKLKLSFSNLRVGRMPLPGSVADAVAGKVLEEVAKKPEYQTAMEVILSVRVNDRGNLEVTFVPSKISVLLAPLMQR